MNSQQFKEKFGVSKTTYKNMRKQQLLGEEYSFSDALIKFKQLRKERKLKLKKLQQQKHRESFSYRSYKGKPRKRKDGKIRGSVKRH